MRARHPLVWLITDERMGAGLWGALRRLPPGAGVVFRHYATPARERRALFLAVRRIAHARRLVVAVAGGALPGADGVHRARGPGLVTWPAHDRREAIAGKRAGAGVLFVSPVFPTRSHPDAPALGPARAAWIGRGLGLSMIALGGMDARRWRRSRGLEFEGWAAIDAWLPRPSGSACGRRIAAAS
jgi:thiamine-phosphate pyrophosphorylase